MRLEKMVKTYQYGWLINKVNWNTFTIKEDNGMALLFGNRVMIQAYKKNYEEVIGVIDYFYPLSALQVGSTCGCTGP